MIAAGAEELERIRAVSAPFGKVLAVVAGGESRCESVRNGLNALLETIELVLVHDAARPLVAAELISRVIAATIEHGAAVPGLPLSDTVKRVGSDGMVRATISRSVEHNGEILNGLTAVQTPQGAKRSLLRAAYAAYDLPTEPTDEASLLEAFGAPVAIAIGDAANIKITRPEDIALAERLLNTNTVVPQEETALSDTRYPTPDTPSAFPEIRTGFGYDVHAFAAPSAGRALFIGGVEIPHDRGLDGHSDADVLLHAVCDALLGATGLGDIGILFPNTDPAYKNISSLKLLSHVGTRIAEAGWRIVNIDIALLAEAPKLMPHRARMQQAMSESLALDASRISVKATTSEGMGFVGRGEGMACWAVATLQK